MKITKSVLSMPLVVLLASLYAAPVAFAGATNSGGNTSATPGDNSSTTTPAGNVVPDPGTPATRAQTPSSDTGGTAHERSDTSKAGEMKSKTMKNCETPTDRNCDKTKMR